MALLLDHFHYLASYLLCPRHWEVLEGVVMNSFVLAIPLLILFISFGDKEIGSILAVSENYF